MVMMLARIPKTSSAPSQRRNRLAGLPLLPSLVAVAAQKTSSNLRDNARNKDNEGVNTPESPVKHRHHIAIGNMADFHAQ